MIYKKQESRSFTSLKSSLKKNNGQDKPKQAVPPNNVKFSAWCEISFIESREEDCEKKLISVKEWELISYFVKKDSQSNITFNIEELHKFIKYLKQECVTYNKNSRIRTHSNLKKLLTELNYSNSEEFNEKFEHSVENNSNYEYNYNLCLLLLNSANFAIDKNVSCVEILPHAINFLLLVFYNDSFCYNNRIESNMINAQINSYQGMFEGMTMDTFRKLYGSLLLKYAKIYSEHNKPDHIYHNPLAHFSVGECFRELFFFKSYSATNNNLDYNIQYVYCVTTLMLDLKNECDKFGWELNPLLQKNNQSVVS